MPSPYENVSMALFCDFENVALGVRDANYDKFDIKPILERLLLKGSIVVKKAYCDWDRYKSFKATMHEANFELIEIPHVRQSGKNSADIRLVVDALDLCYTKAHVNTFVIISGDSDFSPLVSKLRENAKQVIGVGVKQSTSDLLIANCDEFIFYDDLVRESRRAAAKRDTTREAQPVAKRSPDEEKRRKEEIEGRKRQAIDIALETFDALVAERGDSGKIWASVLKEAIKRRKPDFNESYYGFRAFGNLLEEAQARGLLEFGRDEKSGAYVYRSSPASGEAVVSESAAPNSAVKAEVADEATPRQEPRRKGRSGRKSGEKFNRDDKNVSVYGERNGGAPSEQATAAATDVTMAPEAATVDAPAAPEALTVDVSVTSEAAVPEVLIALETDVAATATPARQEARRKGRTGRKPAGKFVRDEKTDASLELSASADDAVALEPVLPTVAVPESAPEATETEAAGAPEPRRKGRTGRKPASKAAPVVQEAAPAAAEPVAQAEPEQAPEAAPEAAPAKAARKPAARSRRPRKTDVPLDEA
jgi:uncharacterized LabA/DUF88 family protein